MDAQPIAAVTPENDQAPRRLTAIEIAAEYRKLIDASEDGEVTPELEAVAGDLVDKVAAYRIVMRELQAKANSRRELAKHYSAGAAADDAQVARMEETLGVALSLSGERRIATPFGGVRFQNFKCVALPANFLEVAPEHLVKVTREPKRQLLADMLKKGEAVPEGVAFEDNWRVVCW